MTNSALATLSRISKHWAMREDAFLALQERIAAGVSAFNEPRSKPQARGATLILPVWGTITPKRYFCSGCALNELAADIHNAVYGKAKIDRIILDIDSPGGSVAGLEEVSQTIRRYSPLVPIDAVVTGEAASAAYHIASQCSRIFCTPSGDVGSIGVWAAHADLSGAMDQAGIKVTLISAGKYKVEGHPYGPLADEARAEIQRGVNLAYDNFLTAVAKGRRTSKATVERTYGQGRMFEAPRALALGMVDEIATMNDVLIGATAAGRRDRVMKNLHRADVFSRLDALVDNVN